MSVLGEEDPGAAMDQLFVNHRRAELECDASGCPESDRFGAVVVPEFAVPESASIAVAEAHALSVARVTTLDAVARSRLLVVGVDTHLQEVAALMSNARLSLAVVCNPDGCAVGVIADTLLVRQLGLGHSNIFTTRAGDVMSVQFTSCRASDSLAGVLAQMHTHGFIHVPVIDADKRPHGVIYARDGLRALLAAGNYEEAHLRDYVMGVGYL